MPRPPRPPLFPYTTLFRSAAPEVVRRFEAGGPARRADGAYELAEEAILALEPGPNAFRLVAVNAGGEESARLALSYVTADRKSTRLNSSHANISYAVFCLK